MTPLDENRKRVLTTSNTSKFNKLHLAIGWKDRGFFVEYKLDKLSDEVRFQFEPNGPWVESKSLDKLIADMKGGE